MNICLNLIKLHISLSSKGLCRKWPGRGDSPLRNPLPAGAGRGEENWWMAAVLPKRCAPDAFNDCFAIALWRVGG